VTLLLFILAGVWALVLVPPYFRNRSERPADSISSFRQQLHTLERTRPGSRPITPRAISSLSMQPIAMRTSTALPSGRAEARRRRRDILFTLGGTVAITLLLAIVLGGAAVVLCQLVADALLGGYVFLLVQLRKTEAERGAKVRYLPTPVESVEPTLLLRRSASN